MLVRHEQLGMSVHLLVRQHTLLHGGCLVSLLGWIVVIGSVLLVYFLAAGLAFATMYIIGRRFPSRFAGILFAPLERLASRFPSFRRSYDAYLSWCYSRFAA